MTPYAAVARRLLAALAIALPLAAAAEPTTYFVPYNGAGNLSVFDASAGTGGWVGQIDQTPPPDVPEPLSLVSFVLFQLDYATQTLTGSFEFTTTDLASTLFGSLTGSFFDDDILTTGGQFSIDYSIGGGSGAFAGASGFGLAFVDFDPAGSFNNYTESGLLNFTVPEPATLPLVAACLLGFAISRKRAQPVNWRA
jgi:hypothetical protein